MALAACRNLVKRYGDVVAVNGLDLSIERGECLGLLGPNGAGKTTTVEILEGLTKPDSGEVELFGMRWGSGQDRTMRAKMGVALQETQLADKLSVRETLRLFRSFFDRGRGVDEVIDALELGEKRDAWVGKLSGGQRQRLALGCALVGDPELLFLDEPSTGLDPQARRRVWEIVHDFIKSGGTVCLTTHYMEEAAQLAKRVVIVDHGKLIAEGTPESLIAALDAPEIIELSVETPIECDALKAVPGVKSAAAREDGSYVLQAAGGAAVLLALSQWLGARGAKVRSLSARRATLEDVFIQLTGRGLRDD